MNINLIGYKYNVDFVNEVIRKNFKELTVHKIYIEDRHNLEDIKLYIKQNHAKYDAIIFTEKNIYTMLNSSIHSKKPWLYLENNEDNLKTALLKADFNIDVLSIDSYNASTVEKLYTAIEHNYAMVFISDINELSENYNEKLLDFHIKHHKLYHTSALTSVEYVYDKLVKENIPAILINLSESLVINSIYSLLEKIKYESISVNQIAVIAIEKDVSSSYDLYNDNEYAAILEKTKLTEEILKFAFHIQAAVTEYEKSYFLFTTRKILEFETNNLRDLRSIEKIIKHIDHTINIGIGFGTTAREAKANSVIGKNKGLSMEGNQLFIVRKKDSIQRIKFNDVKKEEFNEEYQSIAEKTGISINNIYKLRYIMDIYKKDTFTSVELSKEFSNSTRSMNRIIEKLIRNNYAKVIGKRIINDVGRPSRVIKILIK